MSYWDKKYADGFFNVSRENGFLPIRDPLKILPNEYKELQYLIVIFVELILTQILNY
jgi:hypothetical protein